MGAAHAPARGRGFLFWNGHCGKPLKAVGAGPFGAAIGGRPLAEPPAPRKPLWFRPF
jgi:hypothetical protein